jgi:hypothetical protein
MKRHHNDFARSRRYARVLVAAAFDAARRARHAGGALDAVQSAWRDRAVPTRSLRGA